MATGLVLFSACVTLIMSGVESWYSPDPPSVPVPQTLVVGWILSRAGFADCALTGPVSLEDPALEMRSSGLPSARERTFLEWSRGGGGLGRKIRARRAGRPGGRGAGYADQVYLKRSKRRWSPPPFNILENSEGTYPKDIEKIVSDSEVNHTVYYLIHGHGADKHPVGVFSLHRYSGMLIVHRPVDREEFPHFKLEVSVHDRYTRQETDDPLFINIEIDDVNDNAPQFSGPQQFTVLERSVAGTVAGMVTATDRDKPGSDHVKIKYTLLSGLDLFAVNPVTGVITTKTNTLDREVKDKHLVIVKIQDLFGAAEGLFNTATATISVADINDNPPTFTKPSYDVSVKENEREKLILRIPVEDKDLINTPNWISKFVIKKGNEDGNFRIDHDPKTNEGLLYVSKALNHEKNKNVNLEIVARNEADLSGTDAQWLSIPVNVAVTDVDEGPEFSAPTVQFVVKENTPNGTVIGTYSATDPETKSSDGIKYYKVNDPASWINVDRNTGELKVANTIDRESHFVQNGLYNITMKAIDSTSKTATGTVIILVEDANDNVPELPTAELVMCEREGEMGSVVVVAEDNDQAPFSDPFSFALPENHDGTWSMQRLNNTAAVLQQLKELPTGIHEVPVVVTDLQGSGKEQTAIVRICQCRHGVCLSKDRSMSLGPLALLAMLLPLALLLLLCLLLAFFCMTKTEKMELEDAGDSGGILLKSNTEAPGDEVDSSLINIPTLGGDAAAKGSIKGSMLNSGWLGNKSSSSMGGLENGMYKTGMTTTNMQEFYSSQYDSQFDNQQFGGQLLGSGMGVDYRLQAQDSAFLQTWETNGRYLHQKLGYLGAEEDGRYADDIIHAYGFEGVGSTAGSVGCCSDYADNDDLGFLNTLGPKFKTLAEACTKT